MSRTVLVLTATGTTGAAAVRALAGKGANVRAATRDPGKASFPAGVEAVRFDLDDPTTWPAALAGVDALYLCTPPFRTDEVEVVTALIHAAVAAGVTRIVKLSARGVEADPTTSHRRLELLIEGSGVSWIHLRPTFFHENFIEFYGGSIQAQGSIFLPAGTGETAFVAASDIGDLAAAALLSDRSGEAWEITGPESLDHAAIAAQLSEALGRPIQYVDITPEQHIEALRGYGANEVAVATMSGLYAMVRAGWTAGAVDTVQRELGRPAVSFRAWAAEHAGAWG